MTLEPCLNFSLRKATRVLNRIYDAHLSECGLKIGQYTVLRVINHLRQTTNRELQSIVVMEQTTLTRNLKPLIRDGYISVSPGEDQRVKLLSLSSSGKKLLSRATIRWQQAQSEVKRELGKVQSARIEALSAAVTALQT